MKKRKLLSAALAAVGLAFGSLSAVSYAEDAEIPGESGYSITLENATVEGKEMAAIVFAGLPKEALSIDGTIFNGEPHIHEKLLDEKHDGYDLIWVSDFSTCNTSVCIEFGEDKDVQFCASSYNDYKWVAWSFDDERKDYQIVAEEQGDTITLTAYLDLNDKYLRSLAAKDKWTVSVYADITGSGGSHLDKDGDGHISDDENGASLGTGDSFELVDIKPGKKIELHNLDDMYTAPTQTIKVTNNLTAITPIEEKEFKDAEIEVSEGIDDDVKMALSGITVTDSLGAFDDGVVMNVKGTAQTKNSFSFDITFTKDGKEVQPRENVNVTVKIPLPDFLKNYSTIVMRHYNEDGSVESTKYLKPENGFVIYTANHFSVYELSAQEQQNTDTNNPQSSGSSGGSGSGSGSSSSGGSSNSLGSSGGSGSGSSSSSGSGSSSKSSASETPTPAANSTNPDTGISISLAPAILAAGVVVSALNKKRR